MSRAKTQVAITPTLAAHVRRRRELMTHTDKMRPREWLEQINDLDNDIACEFAFLVEQAYQQTSPGKIKKASTTNANATPPAIGKYWPGQGGIYVGVAASNGMPWHLILHTEATELTWGEYDKKITGADDAWDGLQNTVALVKNKECAAAKWTTTLTADGHQDFYLPARNELNLIFENAKKYCKKTWHWSSTQYSALGAWLQYFEGGNQNVGLKVSTLAVRAVRRLPI